MAHAREKYSGRRVAVLRRRASSTRESTEANAATIISHVWGMPRMPKRDSRTSGPACLKKLISFLFLTAILVASLEVLLVLAYLVLGRMVSGGEPGSSKMHSSLGLASHCMK